jgi:hypothetical protein
MLQRTRMWPDELNSSVVGHLEEDLSPGEMILDFSIIHARRGFGNVGIFSQIPAGLPYSAVL